MQGSHSLDALEQVVNCSIQKTVLRPHPSLSCIVKVYGADLTEYSAHDPSYRLCARVTCGCK